MSVLCCHVARFNLKMLDKRSRIFEPFQDGTFFSQALGAFAEGTRFRQILLLCPETDLTFVEEQANRLTLRIPVRVVPVEQNTPYSIDPEQSWFQPLFFETRDLFGLWSLEGLEALFHRLEADRLVFFNLESFWFLKGPHLDRFFQALDSSEFVWSLGNREEVVAGMDWKRARHWISKLRFMGNQDQQAKTEAWKNLTGQHFAGKPELIHPGQSRGLKENQNHFRQTTLLLRKASGKTPWAAELTRDILKETPALSLRTGFGYHLLRSFEALKEKGAPQSWKHFLSEQISVHPEVIQVECRSAENHFLAEKDLLRAVEAWSFVPFWVLLNPSKEEVERWTKELHASIIGKIYAESSIQDLSVEGLENFYRAGGTVWVAGIRENVPPSEETLLQLLETRDRFPHCFLLFKIRNTGPDNDFSSRFVERWQSLTDGVVIVSDPANAFTHFSKLSETCSKSPHEVWLRTNGKLSLCSEIQTGDLEVVNPSAWTKASTLAGKMPVCQACPERHRYGPKWSAALPEYFSSPACFRDFVESLLFSKNNASLDEKPPEQMLDFLESFLKTDPTNARAWERLRKLEESTSSV